MCFFRVGIENERKISTFPIACEDEQKVETLLASFILNHSLSLFLSTHEFKAICDLAS